MKKLFKDRFKFVHKNCYVLPILSCDTALVHFLTNTDKNLSHEKYKKTKTEKAQNNIKNIYTYVPFICTRFILHQKGLRY